MVERYAPWPPPPPPPVATGYSYPVLPPGMVPAMRPKLNRRRLTGIGGSALGIFVVIITVIAVLVRVIPANCSRGCGPATGTVVNASTYTNQKWGYTVPYDSSDFTIGDQNADGATFNTRDGNGSIAFVATSGTNVNGANQAAVNALPSSTFQNLQQVGPVRGAEIGLVNAEGTAFSGNYVDPVSGATPIGLVVFSASNNGVTITVTAFSAASNSNNDAPYGLSNGKQMDFLVTLMRWKGG
jgi:hypothetical protein